MLPFWPGVSWKKRLYLGLPGYLARDRAVENWMHSVFCLSSPHWLHCKHGWYYSGGLGSPAPWMMLLFLQLWWWTLVMFVAHQGARSVMLIWLVEAANDVTSLLRHRKGPTRTPIDCAIDCLALSATNLQRLSHCGSLQWKYTVKYSSYGRLHGWVDTWSLNPRVTCVHARTHLRMSEGM